MSSKLPRAVHKGLAPRPYMPDGHLVSLLRTPDHYPRPIEWNLRYFDAVSAAIPSKTVFTLLNDVLAAVDAEILDAGFRLEDEYNDWLVSWRDQASEPSISWAVDSEILRGLKVLYRDAPAGLNAHDTPQAFRNPYVDIVVSDRATAFALVLAFKGT